MALLQVELRSLVGLFLVSTLSEKGLPLLFLLFLHEGLLLFVLTAAGSAAATGGAVESAGGRGTAAAAAGIIEIDRGGNILGGRGNRCRCCSCRTWGGRGKGSPDHFGMSPPLSHQRRGGSRYRRGHFDGLFVARIRSSPHRLFFFLLNLLVWNCML